MPKKNATTEIDLSVDIAGVTLANPLMTASGTCGYADEYAGFVDLRQLGAFVTKSITLAPRQGHQYQRVVETRAGLLNAIGLANVGLEVFLTQKVPLLKQLGLPVFVNVAGTTVDDYVAVAAALEQVEAVRGVELNISCPNTKAGGMQFGTDPAQVSAITAELRRVCRKNILIVKFTLSPSINSFSVRLTRRAVRPVCLAISAILILGLPSKGARIRTCRFVSLFFCPLGNGSVWTSISVTLSNLLKNTLSSFIC